jgi:hypothetical protein
MHKKTKIVMALIVFLALPLLFSGLFINSLSSIYSTTSILANRGQGNSLSNIPPLGIANVNLTFVKNDVQNDLFTITLDLSALSNQTVITTWAIYQPDFKEYANASAGMQSKSFISGFSTGSFKATYSTLYMTPTLTWGL